MTVLIIIIKSICINIKVKHVSNSSFKFYDYHQSYEFIIKRALKLYISLGSFCIILYIYNCKSHYIYFGYQLVYLFI